MAKYRAETPKPVKKKAKKAAAKPKGKLSFALDDEEDEDSSLSAAATPRSMSKSNTPRDQTPNEDSQDGDDSAVVTKKLKPNANVAVVAKARTKAVLLREAQAREQMRKDFLITKELVKNTDIVVPFIFYDGAKTPGGKVRVKKGDHIWVFLDKARKVGAELAIGEDRGGKSWARVSVDDLMLVRGSMIIPHVNLTLPLSTHTHKRKRFTNHPPSISNSTTSQQTTSKPPTAPSSPSPPKEHSPRPLPSRTMLPQRPIQQPTTPSLERTGRKKRTDRVKYRTETSKASTTIRRRVKSSIDAGTNGISIFIR